MLVIIVAPFIEHLLCARHCANYETYINVIQSSGKPHEIGIILIIPVGKRKQGSEMPGKLFEVTQSVNRGVGMDPRSLIITLWGYRMFFKL